MMTTGGYAGSYGAMRAAGRPGVRAGGSPYGYQADGAYGGFMNGNEEVSTLWVGDIVGEVTSAELHDAFSGCGTVSNVAFNTKPAASGARSAFVRFATRDEATVALAGASSGQVTLQGRPLICQWARSNTFDGGERHSHGSLLAVQTMMGAAKDHSAPAVYGYAESAAHYQLDAAAALAAARDPLEQAAAGGADELSKFLDSYYQGQVLPNSVALAGLNPALYAAHAYQEYAGAAAQQEELTTLWIGNLPEGTTDGDIVAVFSSVGQVLTATVNQRPSPLGSYNGFVRMATRREAEQVLAWCSSGRMLVHGAQALARWAKGNSKVSGASSVFHSAVETPMTMASASAGASVASGGSVRTLFLGGLPVDVTVEEVQWAFQQIGLEGHVTLCQAKTSSRGGSGFIKFETQEYAMEAFGIMCQNPPSVRGQAMAFDWARQDSFR